MFYHWRLYLEEKLIKSMTSVDSIGKIVFTICFLGFKLMTSLVQDEPIDTYSHPYIGHFKTKACNDRSVGAKIQQFQSRLCKEISGVLPNQLKTNSQDTCNLMQEIKVFVDVYRQKYGYEFDILKGADED